MTLLPINIGLDLFPLLGVWLWEHSFKGPHYWSSLNLSIYHIFLLLLHVSLDPNRFSEQPATTLKKFHLLSLVVVDDGGVEVEVNNRSGNTTCT